MDFEKFRQYNNIALSTVYSEPEQGNFHTDLIPQMVDKFFKPLNIPVTASVLDIGCGQGTFMDVLSKLGYVDLIGITKSEDDARACYRKRYFTAQVDMSDLPFESKSIDFIWCRHAIEHSPFPLFTLFEFNRVLKDNSKVYIEVPAPACVRKHEYNSNHYSILGEDMWCALFVKAGFEISFKTTFDLNLTFNDKTIPETNLCFVIEKKMSIA